MPMARRLHLGASKVHKWLSLIIGIQLLLWFASGALMSFLPIDKVRGEITRLSGNGRVGQELNPGRELRLKACNRHFSQLLLEGSYRLAIFPHRFHIARSVKQRELVNISGSIARGQPGHKLLT